MSINLEYILIHKIHLIYQDMQFKLLDTPHSKQQIKNIGFEKIHGVINGEWMDIFIWNKIN